MDRCSPRLTASHGPAARLRQLGLWPLRSRLVCHELNPGLVPYGWRCASVGDADGRATRPTSPPPPPLPSPRDSATTRDQHRSRRARAVRAKSTPRRELRLLVEAAEPVPPYPRPATRGECIEAVRPCPYVGCVHHLYLDVDSENGTLKVNFPDLEPHELAESCALDLADRGGVTLEAVGAAMNLTRERVRQIEASAMRRLGQRRRLLEIANGL